MNSYFKAVVFQIENDDFSLFQNYTKMIQTKF